MTDADFIRGFEDCTLPNSSFHHHDHVRLAWLYLRLYPPLEALARFSDGLRRFAAANGRLGLYHETITWAYLLLIHERMARAALTSPGPSSPAPSLPSSPGEEGRKAETWEEFAQRNPDLLTWKPSVLDRYYEQDTLGSELARKVFVLPDRCAGRPESRLQPVTVAS